MDFNYFFDSLYIYSTYQKYIPFGDSSFRILLAVETSNMFGGRYYPGLPYRNASVIPLFRNKGL